MEVAEPRAAIITVNSGLREEHPAAVAHLEKGRESVSVAILRRGIHRCIRSVELLIARLCTHPSYHRIALRRQEGRGPLRETEGGRLGAYYHTACTALSRNQVAEGCIVVGHMPLH